MLAGWICELLAYLQFTIMSNPLTPFLPGVRRIVTTHNSHGTAVVGSDDVLPNLVSAQIINIDNIH